MKLIAAALALFLGQTLVGAQDKPPPPRPIPHDAPHVVLGPPEGFEPPEHKPPMSKDPAEARELALDLFFKFMDADGNGEIDISEFMAWVRHFHMPPPEHEGHVESSSSEGGTCGSTDPLDTPAKPVDCTVTGSGWQEVSDVLSEADCQFGYTDAVQGPQRRVIYDNSYSVACVGGNHEPSVYVGSTPSDSNWGAFVQPSKTCQMKTGTLPSDSSTRVVEKIVCPAP